MNTHVNFETAKLLKEKGFNEKCSHYYVLDFQNFKATGILKKAGTPDDNPNSNLLYFVTREGQPHLVNAPTIDEVKWWFYKTHDIWISVYQYKDHAADVNDDHVFRTSHTKLREFNSPEEAYETAIKHCLTKLI